MIISIKNNWDDAFDIHNEYVNSLIDDFTHTIKSPRNLSRHTVYFLNEIKIFILSSKLEDLKLAARYYDAFIAFNSNEPKIIERVNKDLKIIFNYRRFSSKKKSYDAYDLCAKSKTRTCPYCNQAYSFTICESEGALRPTLDHFYSKDHYPHLSLSLSNLIPSCSTCNSSLKNIKNFIETPHLHPLFDDEKISFKLAGIDGNSSIANLIDINQKDFKIEVVKIKCKKANESIRTFMIEKRYENMIFEAIGFAKNLRAFEEYILNNQLKISEYSRTKTITYFDDANYSCYLLGKLYHDIYQQLKISAYT
ncbi:HNH endonuclease [Serratia fonticola]